MYHYLYQLDHHLLHLFALYIELKAHLEAERIAATPGLLYQVVGVIPEALGISAFRELRGVRALPALALSLEDHAASDREASLVHLSLHKRI